MERYWNNHPATSTLMMPSTSTSNTLTKKNKKSSHLAKYDKTHQESIANAQGTQGWQAESRKYHEYIAELNIKKDCNLVKLWQVRNEACSFSGISLIIFPSGHRPSIPNLATHHPRRPSCPSLIRTLRALVLVQKADSHRSMVLLWNRSLQYFYYYLFFFLFLFFILSLDLI